MNDFWRAIGAVLKLEHRPKGGFCSFYDPQRPDFGMAVELSDKDGFCFCVCSGHMVPAVGPFASPELLISLLEYNERSQQPCFVAADRLSDEHDPVLKLSYRFLARWDDNDLVATVIVSCLKEMAKMITAYQDALADLLRQAEAQKST